MGRGIQVQQYMTPYVLSFRLRTSQHNTAFSGIARILSMGVLTGGARKHLCNQKLHPRTGS